MAAVNIQDTKAVELQSKLTNYAEACEKTKKPQFFVKQISFIITALADEDVDAAKVLRAKDQEVLNWQARTEKLPDDIESRDDLTSLSGRLCPTRKISSSLFDKVSAHVTEEQERGQCPLSAFRLVSFRSVILTKHYASNGQVHLLFQNDGLPERLSSLGRGFHDYIKVTSSKAPPSYTVFTLVHWDIVDLFDPIHVDLYSRMLSLKRPALEHQADLATASGKFSGVRGRVNENRKSPWIAELRIKSLGRKLWLGSFKSEEAAARAADAAILHYNVGIKPNFKDSCQYLHQMPPNLSDEDVKKFVIKDARLLASLADENPSACAEVLASLPLWGSIANLNNDPSPYFMQPLAGFPPGFLAPGSMMCGPSSSQASSQPGAPMHTLNTSYNYQDSIPNDVPQLDQFMLDFMPPLLGQNPDNPAFSYEVARDSPAVSDSASDHFGQQIASGRPTASGGFISDASLLIAVSEQGGSNRDVETASYLCPVVSGDFLGFPSSWQ